MAFGEKEFYELFHRPEVLPYIVGNAGLEPCRKLSDDELRAIAAAAGEAAAKNSQDAADRAEEALNSVRTIMEDVRRALSIANNAQDMAETAIRTAENCVAECKREREAFEVEINAIVNKAVESAAESARQSQLSREALDRALELIKAFTCCSRPSIRDIYNVNSSDGCLSSLGDMSCSDCCGVKIVSDDDDETVQVTTGCCGGLNITYNESTNDKVCNCGNNTPTTGTEGGGE